MNTKKKPFQDLGLIGFQPCFHTKETTSSLSQDIVTLAEFKSPAATLLERIGTTSQPLLITLNGKPAGVLLSPAEFDRIQKQETARFVASINRGLQDVDHGRTLTSAQVNSRLGLK